MVDGAEGVARSAAADERRIARRRHDRLRLRDRVLFDCRDDELARFGCRRRCEQLGAAPRLLRQAASDWNTAASSKLVGRLLSSTVGSKRRAISAVMSSATRLRMMSTRSWSALRLLPSGARRPTA